MEKLKKHFLPNFRSIGVIRQVLNVNSLDLEAEGHIDVSNLLLFFLLQSQRNTPNL